MVLGQFQDSRSVEPLIKLLRDPVPLVRATAAQVLGQLEAGGAVSDLVDLLRDPDATVRLRAAESLDQLGWQPEDEATRTAHILATGNLEQRGGIGRGWHSAIG